MQVVVEKAKGIEGWVAELVFSFQRDAFCCPMRDDEG